MDDALFSFIVLYGTRRYIKRLWLLTKPA